MAADPNRTLLCKAADLLGRQHLATGLKVPLSVVDAWVSGQAAIPPRQLSALAELLDEISNPPRK